MAFQYIDRVAHGTGERICTNSRPDYPAAACAEVCGLDYPDCSRPFAPYTAQELWTELGHAGPVFREPLAGVRCGAGQGDLVEIPVQVNGKVRGHLRVPLGTGKEELERLALANEKAKPFLEAKQIVKLIVIPDRLANIVVK